MAKTPDPEDDDDELELEEVDPEILQHARQRADRHVQETEARAAQLEIYDSRVDADPISLGDLQGFRFTTRHLLIATAVLAIVMTMVRTGCNGIFFGGLTALAFGWWYVWHKERTEQRARDRRRMEAEARLAELRKGTASEATASTTRMAGLEPAEEPAAHPLPPLRFNFSLKQMFWAFAIATVVLAITSAIGPEITSWSLGIIAVTGLVIQLMGFELPSILLFGWWVLLVLYLVMSLFTIAAPGAGP